LASGYFELLKQGEKLFIYSKIVTKGWEEQEALLIQELRPKWNSYDPIRELREVQTRQNQPQAIAAPVPAPTQQTEVTEEEKQRILSCKDQGLNQDDTIKQIWGVSKSGTDKRYLAYKQKYQFVCKELSDPSCA
jgi:hypothetical protein